MRAIQFKSFGGPDVLEEAEVKRPVPGPAQVLVRVKATSVNPLDIQMRRGDYAGSTPLPGRLGADVAGTVELVGSAVESLKPGDDVFYVPRLLRNEGSYAEYHVEDAEIVTCKPRNLSFEQSAALPLAAGTAWECLIERAKIVPGERVLVHGGSGGVGAYAVQIAHAVGAFVVATSRQENADFVRAQGADAVVDYRAEDIEAQLQAILSDGGFDIVLDTVGGQTIENSLRLLANFGRLVSIVDHTVPQNLIEAWGRNAAIHFVFTTQSAERLRCVKDFAERGLIRPLVERVMPLGSAAMAQEAVEAGRRRGKIVLAV